MNQQEIDNLVAAYRAGLETKRDRKKETLIAFLLDETQSMMICKDKTISSFNEYVNTLRDKNDFNFCLTRFNSNKIDVGEITPIQTAIELTKENYNPTNWTPLYDAIGKTIASIENKSTNSDVLFVILTDGEENSSKEFKTKDKIVQLITQKSKDGWTFIYLGANQDAWAAGVGLGISGMNTMNFANDKVHMAMSSLAMATTRNVAMGATCSNTSFFNKDEQDQR